MTSPQSEVTQLLLAWSHGDEAALAKLIPQVESELHRLAMIYLSRERPGHSLQATALVNEAFLKLIDSKSIEFQNRAHFFGITANIMRRILVDHARRRHQLKRGGEALQVSLAEADNVGRMRSASVIALDDAMEALAQFDPRKCQIVELKFFGGLNEEEIAEVMKLSLRTVQRDWNLARAWLYNELNRKKDDDA
ncbi:MAG: sigma-70 family RNA polymerase sigma factor [Blastocatellia bacterium]|nr:sigma-70 family RNA polymerase sigma factor [Blastocatellia bacterium]